MGVIPLLMDSIATAAITPLAPGAGPPPTRTPNLRISILVRFNDVTELLHKVVDSHVRSTSKVSKTRTVFKIALVEPDHVVSSHKKTRTVRINIAHSSFSGLGITHICKRKRHQPPVLNADHRTAASIKQKANCGISKVATVIC